MALAGPAVVLLSGVLDNSERLGALLHHPECSALVIGVVEVSQQKRPTAWRPGQMWLACQCMALAAPAVVIADCVRDNFDRLGALLHDPECSALVIGVVELS